MPEENILFEPEARTQYSSVHINVHNLEPINKTATKLPVSREHGAIKTLEWITSEGSQMKIRKDKGS